MRVLLCAAALSLAGCVAAPPVTIDVEVGDGLAPEISFDGGGVAHLRIYDDPGADVSAACHVQFPGTGSGLHTFWGLRSDGSQGRNTNNISSPITYGVTPVGSISELLEVEPLVAGSPVCIALTRVDDSGYRSQIGLLVFTP